MPTGYAVSTMPACARPGHAPRGPLARLARRLAAHFRLLMRRRRAARRFEDLRHLDERTLRDLGISRSELGSIVAEVGGRTAATRRRTEFEHWRPASAPLRVRAVDACL